MSTITYGVAGNDTILSMSGLDYMRGVLAGTHPHPPMAGHMGLRLITVEEGRVVFEGAPTDAHLNPMGTTHGGWFGTILDSALGCAVMTTMLKGSVYTTLEYKVNLTRGLAPCTLVQADARVDHTGRTTAVAQVELRGVDDGRLYATGSTTCLVMTPR